jgi:hypothetical protein
MSLLRRRRKPEVPPEDALTLLADQLRVEDSVISPHVRITADVPSLGLLAASAPRTQGARAEYAVLVEAIREGYLLHYATPRLVDGVDSDLALLAGDYLYALGLRRLSLLGDLDAVRELSDLISLAAQVHAPAADDERTEFTANALWLAAVTAVASGPSDGNERAKAALRESHPNAAAALLAAAQTGAVRAGIPDVLERTADSIGLDSSHLPDLG